jgi:hypothetical protein
VGMGKRAYRQAVERPEVGSVQYFPWDLGK